jgi:hypothetical protein
MVVQLWIGEDFHTSHERKALHYFLAEMQSILGQQRDPYFILANYYIDGRQIDLTVLKHDAIIIIELKECSDPFRATENGQWVTFPAGDLIGTGEQNPFSQAKDYRFRWMDLLKRNQTKFLSPTKAQSMRFDHVSAFVVISPSLHKQVQLELPNLPWFQLVGLDYLAQAVVEQTSRHLYFSDDELKKLIVNVLNLAPREILPNGAYNSIANTSDEYESPKVENLIDQIKIQPTMTDDAEQEILDEITIYTEDAAD